MTAPSIRAADAFFDRHARHYDRLFAPPPAATARELGALLANAPRGGDALDLGAGTGRAWPALLEAGLSIVGVDASEAMLAQARRRSSAASVIAHVHDLYALPWPLESKSFDVVLALHAVFAHPPEALTGDDWRPRFAQLGREIRRVARPNALVVVDVPEPDWARTHLIALGDDRYAHRDDDGALVPALVADPTRIVQALGLPLTLTASATGARAVGRLEIGHP